MDLVSREIIIIMVYGINIENYLIIISYFFLLKFYEKKK